MKPRPELDSSKVLYWAWSDDQPFYIMKSIGVNEDDIETTDNIEIYGLAICLLAGTIYLFYCNRHWEVQNDIDFDTIQEAMNLHFNKYENLPIYWNKFDDTDIDDLIAGSRRVKFYQEVGGRRIIQKIVNHLQTNNCNGMVVQLIAKDTWLLSIKLRDIPIASEIATRNVE